MQCAENSKRTTGTEVTNYMLGTSKVVGPSIGSHSYASYF